MSRGHAWKWSRFDLSGRGFEQACERCGMERARAPYTNARGERRERWEPIDTRAPRRLLRRCVGYHPHERRNVKQ